MKIQSNFSDYYDSIIAYGTDPLITYKRFTVTHKAGIRHFGKSQRHSKYSWRCSYPIELHRIYTNVVGLDITNFYIFFCNEIYIGWKVKKGFNNVDFFYTRDSILKYIKDLKIDNSKLESIVEDIDARIKLLSEYKENLELHIRYSSPVIILADKYNPDSKALIKEEAAFIINPCLKDYKFQKIKEPFTAFQEISQFISNTFGYPGNEMVEVSDKTKIAKHGFDKWSFRKMKEGT